MSVDGAAETIHASAVVVDGCGILIRGASGSGKSSLALALIDDTRLSALLVGDDRLELMKGPAGPVVRAPEVLAGLIEVRGIGVLTIDYVAEAPIALVVDLLPPQSCPRYPDDAERTTSLLGCFIPRLALPIGANDGSLRVRIALREWMDAVNTG